jgi:rhodanese-related sulfurtransferase
MNATEAFDVRESVTFLDVREPYEYEGGHIEGCIHIPIGAIGAQVDEIPADRPLVVVCQVGQRSELVAAMLAGRGLDAENLEGGLESWVAAGLPLVGSSGLGNVVDGRARDLSGNRLFPDNE